MDLHQIKAVYFIGIGGIGMSAIARFFLHKGIPVAGYDRIPSELTKELEKEGALIHYTENVAEIPQAFRERSSTLVVFTPAIPATHKELVYFMENDFDVEKRAQVLGILTRSHKGLCVAGTHGKTTTSTMAAYLLEQSHVKCSAFLGGISKNFGTNYVFSKDSDYIVIEADEFDRSFHWLTPYMSVITATDPDHLDIYGTKEAYLESFTKYSSLIKPEGALIIHTGLEMKVNVQDGVKVYTYSRNEGDFHADNIRIGHGEIIFDFISPLGDIKDIQLGVPISINIENGIAAMALAQMNGVTPEEIRAAMATFKGVERRFDFKIKNDKMVLLSDYAHHPTEIRKSIESIREVFNDKKISVLFQPHLFTRTQDFYKDFAKSLSLADEVILLDIYPAREKPIPGVTSKLIYDELRPGIEKKMIHKDDILPLVEKEDFQVLIVLGAGDVDNYTPEIKKILLAKD